MTEPENPTNRRNVERGIGVIALNAPRSMRPALADHIRIVVSTAKGLGLFRADTPDLSALAEGAQ